MFKKIVNSLVVAMLLVSLTANFAFAETWGEWSWKWGSKAVVGGAAVALIVVTAPISGPALICTAGAVGTAGAAATAHAQGDTNARDNLLIGTAAFATGGAATVAAPAIGATISAAGIGSGAGCTGAAASSGGLATLGLGSTAAGGAGVVGGEAVIASVAAAPVLMSETPAEAAQTGANVVAFTSTFGLLNPGRVLSSVSRSVTPSVLKEVAKTEIHHFVSNKNSVWTPKFDKILKKYKLDIDGDWNKELLPHNGRHTENYLSWTYDQLKKCDQMSNGNSGSFLENFEKLIKSPVRNNPEVMYM